MSSRDSWQVGSRWMAAGAVGRWAADGWTAGEAVRWAANGWAAGEAGRWAADGWAAGAAGRGTADGWAAGAAGRGLWGTGRPEEVAALPVPAKNSYFKN